MQHVSSTEIVRQEPFTSGSTFTARRWEVLDLVFEGPAQLDTPLDVEFGAAFRGPGDAELRIPGFYDGSGRFVLRFSPPQEGAWRFETYSSAGSLAGLRAVVEASPPQQARRRGPVVLEKSRSQRFFYADGTPYFPLAFEADWLFALDCRDPQDIPKTKRLVDFLAGYGFNQIVMNVYAYDVTWPRDPKVPPEHDYGAPSVFPFGGSNDAPDHSTLNIAFFQHLDRIVAFLDERGIVAHLMIYVWNKRVNWPDAGSTADNRYFDYVTKRYQAFRNVVWDVSKEALGYGHNDVGYITDRIERLRRLDAYGRLVTVHDYGYCAKFPERVDFIAIQSWASGLYHVMRAVGGRHPDKPVVNIEHGGYEAGPYLVFDGDYLDPQVCLERAYECVFAGVYPTHYWQCAAWSVVLSDPLGLPEKERPKLAYYRHLTELLARYDFTALTPADNRSSSGYCLASARGQYLFLVPAQNAALHVRLPTGENAGVQVRWFHPLSGEFHEMGKTDIGSWHAFASPWPGQMAVLILEKAAEK